MSLAMLQGHAMALALSVLKRTSDGWEGIGEVVTTRVTNSEAEPGQILPHQREPSKRAPGPGSFCTWRRPHWGFTPWANPQPIFQLAQTAASATLSEQPLHTQLRSLNWATSSLWSSMVQRPLALLCYSFLGDTLEPRAQKLSFLSWVFCLTSCVQIHCGTTKLPRTGQQTRTPFPPSQGHMGASCHFNLLNCVLDGLAD